MGGQAGHTADSIGELSEKLSLQSGVDDEVIQAGQNVLLTFGKVRNEVGKGNDIFDRAAQSALDMSVALGQDLQGSTVMLGKALNDPIKGITAMSRAGVSFTEQQKEQIKAMVEAGDVLGAQKIILSEMENQFGGSAAAQATAGDKLKVVWGNLQETLGGYLVPAVEAVATWLADKLPKAMEAAGQAVRPLIAGAKQIIGVLFQGDFKGGPFSEDSKVVDIMFRVRDAVKAVAGFVAGTLIPGLVKLGRWVIEHKPVLIGLATAIGVGLVAAFVSWAIAAGAAAVATLAAAAPVIAIGAAIAALVAGIVYAYTEWDWFRTTVDTVARFLTDTLWPALQSIASFVLDDLIPAVAGIIQKFVDFHVKAVEIAVGVVEAFVGIVDFMSELPGKIGEYASAAWEALKEGLKAAIDWIVDQIDRALGPIDELLGAAASVLGKKAAGTGGLRGMGLRKFDTGGVVPGPRGTPQLILAHAGETILPTHKRGMAPLAAGAGSGLAVDARVWLDTGAGAETAFKTWMRKAFRTDRGMAA